MDKQIFVIVFWIWSTKKLIMFSCNRSVKELQKQKQKQIQLND